MSQLVIVDGNALAARIFYAGGQPEGATDLVASLTPEGASVLWCFDGERPYWRHELHAEYKGTRTKHPPGYAEGLAALKLKVPASFEVPGFEADDLIASLVAQRTEGTTCRVLTTDKDLLQLVRPGVEVWRPSALGWLEDDPETALGVRADLVVDFLAIVGCASDNVSGCPGVGKVKAQKMLAAHGSLDAAIAAGAIPAQYVDAVLLSRRLVTLAADVPLELCA
jgi:DNA polymerase-1